MLPNSPRSNPDSDKPHPAPDTLSLGHSRTANVPKDALPRYNRA